MKQKNMTIKHSIIHFCFNSLIIIDMFLITTAIIFKLPQNILTIIQYFDLFVCLILLIEYTYDLYKTSFKKEYILNPGNIIGLIASIPFDFILVTAIPGSGLLRYLRLFKLSRVFLLSSRIKFLKKLCEKTGLHKLLLGVLGIILLFTLLFYLFGPSYRGFDDFYFVIVTLTTVGYGDVTPQTYNEKVLTIMLIIIGIFIFSTFTAMISSFLTDYILKEENNNVINLIDEKYNNFLIELKSIHEENKKLREEIQELKKRN